jgi:Domain of unknown function (DUF5076)
VPIRYNTNSAGHRSGPNPLLSGGYSLSELPTPPDLGSDPEAAEILRVWIVQKELRAILHAGAFEEPGTWGILLADVVRTITSALKENEGKDTRETLREIVTAFQEELANEPEE